MKGREGISIDPTVPSNNILKYQNSQGNLGHIRQSATDATRLSLLQYLLH